MTCMMYVTQIGLLFCFVVNSKALGHCKGKCEDVQLFTISTPLKSEIFLPCSFETSNSTTNKTNRASWSHFSSLLEITQDGNIIFDDPREGRVTVFPILAAGGNFSIIIHNVQASDLGSYCCELNRECRRLDITETTHTDPYKNNFFNPWMYFAAGAGLFILLFIAFYLFAKLWGNCLKNPTKSNSVNGLQNEGNHTEERQNTERSEHRNPNNRGRGRENATVYENDAHAPNQMTAVQQRQNPQRAFRTAPPEPPTSEASNPKPYYVNQEELSVSSNADKKRKKTKPYQYKNPIYGD